MRIGLIAAAVAGLIASTTASAARRGELVVYCSAHEEWCAAMAQAFEARTGVKVSISRKSAGETLARISAEAGDPRGDVWWGGDGASHLDAAASDLTEYYESPMLWQLQTWAVRFAAQSGFRSVGVSAEILGYGLNTDLLAGRSAAEPRCWSDLIKPELKGRVQMAEPSASSASYVMLATLVQLMGDDRAFGYLGALRRNLARYSVPEAQPGRTGAEAALVEITLAPNAISRIVAGAPLKLVTPCEGTGYEIGAMSIIRGARNIINAEMWYDWALSREGQEIALKAKAHQVPSNRSAAVMPQARDVVDTPLIDYDFARFGSSSERARLLKRWDEEIEATSKN